jgi:hypothetical protein
MPKSSSQKKKDKPKEYTTYYSNIVQENKTYH